MALSRVSIETLFFKMYKYHDVTAWKGAYHFSPDYTHRYGWAEVNHDLDLIKAEDRQLRESHTVAPAENESVDVLPFWIIGGAALVMLGAALFLRVRSPAPPK